MKRRSARRAFRPGVQGLEPRLVLSNVGVNVDYNGASGDPVWVNVRNGFSAWQATSSATPLSTNALGYPTSSAKAYVDLQNYPDGNYLLSYQGTATMSFSGVGTLAGPITTNSAGVSTGVVVVNHTLGDGTYMWLIVSGVSPTSTFSNFQLDVPGYGSNPTQVFTNTFLHTLEPFSTIRFLDWDLQSNDTTWSTAASANEFETTTGNVPWQDIVALGNEAQKNIWINIPTEATSGYVQSLAQLIYSELDPNLEVYFEYSNETWASGETIFNETLQNAEANPLISGISTNAGVLVPDETAYELVTDEKIFDSVFGAQQNMVMPVFSGFFSYPSEAQGAFQFIQQEFGPVSSYVAEYAVAPYIGLTSQQDVPGLSLTQVFADLNQTLTTSVLSTLESNEALAKSYGVPLATYEGGQALPSGAPSELNYSVFAAAENDPRMYQLYVTMMGQWNQYVGSNDLYMEYMLDGNGFWGMLSSVGSVGSERYDALLSDVLAPADANFDGSVTYADLQTVETYYGQSGTSWQQGDFNGAGVTNYSDLNLVRQAINPTTMTLQQFAQMALFGEPSAINTGSQLEYSAYGVTAVANLPFVSTSGALAVYKPGGNPTVGSQNINFLSGLSVAAGSSETIALGGAYSEFDATLAVDGHNTATTVIYQVYGDGKLLYQSGVITPNNNAIPIGVNVSGVQSLQLDVIGANSNVSADQAIWGDARLLTAAGFGTATPYQVQWTLSENGIVVSSVTAGSFEFGSYTDGAYTLSVTITNSQGQTATASEPINSALGYPGWYSALATSGQVEIEMGGTVHASGYDVYRSTSPLPSSMVLVANDLAIPKYIDTNVTNGTTYYYEVAYVDTSGVVGVISPVFRALPGRLATLDPYLTSLPETAATGTIVVNRSALPDSFGDGATMPITTSGVVSAMGLGTFGNTTYTVALGGTYKSISGLVAVDNRAPSGGAVTFVIIGDGKTLYTSPALGIGANSFNISVAGVKSLMLKTIASGTLINDYGDWASVQFAPANVVPLGSMSGVSTASNQSINSNLAGGPLMIGSTEYQQGVEDLSGTNSYTTITVPLNGNYKTFSAIIGVDSLLGGPLSSVRFEVALTGGSGADVSFGPITTSTAGQAISFNVTGATSMKLYMASVNANVVYDYGDWALAELTT